MPPIAQTTRVYSSVDALKHCKTEGCANKKAPKGSFCYPCKHGKEKAKDPVRFAYITLKGNAHRRGHKFTITLGYFRDFCYRTNYLMGKGRSADSYHVDRIDESKGYVPGNLQVLTNSQNVHKYRAFDIDRYFATGRPGFSTKRFAAPPSPVVHS